MKSAEHALVWCTLFWRELLAFIVSSSENKAQKAAAANRKVQPAKMQHGGNGAGRKREWRPMESNNTDDGERNTDAYSSYNGSRNGLQGEPIEKEMKKLVYVLAVLSLWCLNLVFRYVVVNEDALGREKHMMASKVLVKALMDGEKVVRLERKVDGGEN